MKFIDKDELWKFGVIVDVVVLVYLVFGFFVWVLKWEVVVWLYFMLNLIVEFWLILL